MKSIVNFITGTLATSLLYYLGGWDIALEALIIAVTLDYISGVSNAIYHKELSSKVGLIGIIKKLGYFVIVALAVLLDRIFGETGALRTVVIYFFVSNEGISILENWGEMGLPLPKKLFDILEKLKNKDNEEIEDYEEV